MRKDRRRQLAALLSAAVFGNSMTAFADAPPSSQQSTGRTTRSAIIANPLCAPVGQCESGSRASESPKSARNVRSGRVIRNEYALPKRGTIEIGPARLVPPSDLASAHAVVPAGHSSRVQLVKPRDPVVRIQPVKEQEAAPTDADASVASNTNAIGLAPLPSDNAVVFQLNDLEEQPATSDDSQRQMLPQPSSLASRLKIPQDEPSAEPQAADDESRDRDPVLFRPPVRILKPKTVQMPAATQADEPRRPASETPVRLGGKGFVGGISDDDLRNPEPLVQVDRIGSTRKAVEAEQLKAPTILKRPAPGRLVVGGDTAPQSTASKDAADTARDDRAGKESVATAEASPTPLQSVASTNTDASSPAVSGVALAAPRQAAAEAERNSSAKTSNEAAVPDAGLPGAEDAAPAIAVEAPAAEWAAGERGEQTISDANADDTQAAVAAKRDPIPLLKIRQPAAATAARPAPGIAKAVEKTTAADSAAEADRDGELAERPAVVRKPSPLLLKPANQPSLAAATAAVEPQRSSKPDDAPPAHTGPGASQAGEIAAAEPATGRLQLAVGKPFTYESRHKIARVHLEDDHLCEAVQVDPHRIVVVGKAAGSCRLAVWFEQPSPTARQLIEVDVANAASTNELNQMSEKLAMILIAAYPDERLRIDVQGKLLVVKGRVASEEIARDALRIVRQACLRPVKDEIEVFDR